MENNLKNQLLNKFKIDSELLNGNKEKPLFLKQTEYFNIFEKKGFPNIKDEEYKYTNFNFLNRISFGLPLENSFELSQNEIEPYLFDNLNSNLLVFVNGKINKSLTSIQSFKKGIIVGSLKDAISNDLDLLSNHLEFNHQSDNFNNLNFSFIDDGAYIKIPDGIDLSEPIHLAFFVNTKDNDIFVQPKNIIDIGECCNIKLIVSYHTIGSNNSFTNISTDIKIGNFSNVEFYNLQNDNNNSYLVTNTNISQYRGSVLNSAAITLHGKFVRNNLNSIHKDELCETNFYGFYYVDGDSFVDNHTLVVHAKPNCNSNEIYKGIMDDNSVAVFNGKILVKPNSPKTNAYQKNRNILLTDNATVNTKPQLEIFTDDVKCSHGATTGYLEKEHIFYLKSRGISEERARALLLNAFATEIVEKIKIDELRDSIKADISKRLNVEDDFYFCEILESVK